MTSSSRATVRKTARRNRRIKSLTRSSDTATAPSSNRGLPKRRKLRDQESQGLEVCLSTWQTQCHQLDQGVHVGQSVSANGIHSPALLRYMSDHISESVLVPGPRDGSLLDRPDILTTWLRRSHAPRDSPSASRSSKSKGRPSCLEQKKPLYPERCCRWQRLTVDALGPPQTT